MVLIVSTVLISFSFFDTYPVDDTFRIGMAIGFGFYGIAFEAVGLILVVVYLTDWAQDRGLFTGDRK